MAARQGEASVQHDAIEAVQVRSSCYADEQSTVNNVASNDAYIRRLAEIPFLGTSIPPVLWHYTDAAGLFGILTECRIRGTHVAHLNDSSEIVLGEEIVEEVAQQLAAAYGSDIRRELMKRFITEWKSRLPSRTTQIFATSFCADKPGTSGLPPAGNRLSQWRAYGAGGSGYSIGFKRLPAISGQEGFEEDGLALIQVIYDSFYVRQHVRQRLEGIADVFARNHEECGSRELAERVTIEHMYVHALIFCLMLKHAGFIEECEWRLVGFVDKRPVQYRPSPRGIIPYIEIPVCPPNSLIELEHIFVGPTHHPDAAKHAVVAFLESLRYADPHSLVSHSGIPYRV